jgi:transcriptional regulator with XRE-family HTH domain
MSTYKDITSFFNERGPEDVERFVDKNLDISQQVYALLQERGWSQNDLARKMGKTSAETSKWLSGSHNLTLRSIAKMEAALGKDIIITPQKAKQQYKQIEYVTFKVHANANQLVDKSVHYSNQPVIEKTEQNPDDYQQINRVA